MPYADPIDPTTPDDSAIAGEGDDRIRELKRALIDRIESFFQSIDQQPWQVKLDAIDPSAAFSDATISGAKLINASVPLAKLAALPEVGAGAITTSNLADGSVTTPKLADAAVTNQKIFDGAVDTVKLADASVKRVKLYAGLKSDLCRFQVYTLVLGAVIISAGGVYRGSVNVDTNDQLGGAVACTIQPAFPFSAASDATHPTDYILSQCSITLNGSQEVLVYRLHNLLGSPVDLTGQVYYIWMIQRLSTAPAET